MKRGVLTRLQVAPFQLAIASFFVVSGVRYLADAASLEASSIGQTLPFPEAWAAGYAVAGLLMSIGLLMPSARMEAIGLSLTASMITINAIASAYSGWEILGATQTLVSLFFYAAIVGAALVRLRVLIQGRLVIYSWGRETEDIVVGTAPPLRVDDDT